MHVTSLPFRTDLELLRLGGSTVEDRGSFLVVRTPANPGYFWGNFLLLERPPSDQQELADWLGSFRREFPQAGHAALGIDRPQDGDLSPLRTAGWRLERLVGMTTTDVHPPARPNTTVEVRPLVSDADWAGEVELSLGNADDPHVTRDFVERRARAHRDLVETGHGRWWGAFAGGRLVSSLGLYALAGGLARFQDVKTLRGHRGQGLAGTLVHTASRDALDNLGADRLVMAADPDYAAIRIYRSLGFVEGPGHVEATLLPPLADRGDHPAG